MFSAVAYINKDTRLSRGCSIRAFGLWMELAFLPLTGHWWTAASFTSDRGILRYTSINATFLSQLFKMQNHIHKAINSNPDASTSNEAQQEQFSIRFSSERSQVTFLSSTLSAQNEDQGVYSRIWASEDRHLHWTAYSKKLHCVGQHSSLHVVIAAIDCLSYSHLFLNIYVRSSNDYN